MKAKEVVNLYSLYVPSNKPTVSFFDKQVNTLYFKSKEEAEAYQNAHYPKLKVSSIENLAIQDIDDHGNHSWVLIMPDKDFFAEDVRMTDALKNIIYSHKNIVIPVRLMHIRVLEDEGVFAGPDKKIYTYDIADKVDSNNRFLYSDYSKLCFVDKYKTISITDAMDLVNAKKINAYQQEIDRLQQQINVLKANIAEIDKQTPSRSFKS